EHREAGDVEPLDVRDVEDEVAALDGDRGVEAFPNLADRCAVQPARHPKNCRRVSDPPVRHRAPPRSRTAGPWRTLSLRMTQRTADRLSIRGNEAVTPTGGRHRLR